MLLPSSRKSSGSNFFLFLLTVCNVGWLLLFLLFIIRVIIFPDISFNKEIPQVHPYCCHQFKFHQMRAIRVYTTTRLDQGRHADLTNQILTYINVHHISWLTEAIRPILNKQIPSNKLKVIWKTLSARTDNTMTHMNELCKTTAWTGLGVK